MSWLWEKFCLVILGVFLGIVTLTVFYPPSRTWPAAWIYEKSPELDKADAILIFMGDAEDRTPTAAKLWKQKVAPKIVLVETERDELAKQNLRATDSEITFQYLKKLGIPEDAIIFNRATQVSSTREEAEGLLKTLESRLPQARHIIVCTSWYHSSRTLWTLQRAKAKTAKIRFYSQPSPPPAIWYKKERDFLSVYNEYLKWLYYLISPNQANS